MAHVDVIVPAYNAARYLRAALDSVIAQTFSDWRIVLVDDGSHDETAEIASDYAQRLGDKMLVVRQENRGLPAARNTAIRHGSAPLLALLDADDVWLPNRLEEAARIFHDRPRIGLAHGLIQIIDSDGNVLSTFIREAAGAEGDVKRAIYTRSLNLPCPTMTFRREAIERVGMFDESLRASEDRDLWLRIAQHYPVGFIGEVIAQYRTSPTAMTTDPDRMFEAQMKFVRKHAGAAGCDWIAQKEAGARIYRQYGEAWAERGEIGRALRAAIHAIWLYPLGRENLITGASLLRRALLRN